MTNNYFALYRKYRPENLDDVVGQDVIVTTLKNSILNNHISHAYLFTGPRGTGKTSIAKILAKTINCTDLNETTPCDNCVSCTQINQKQNVDIIEIDAASNNGVDEIREIRNKVNLVPSVSKYKVYIIDEVHMLTTGAFNALLKTLEEPPAHIIFILATTEPHKIPITILSRCQRFDFKRISKKDILKRLQHICDEEKIEITEEALDLIATYSDGGMRDAISTLDQVLAYAGNNIQVDDVHAINGTVSLSEISEFVDNIFIGDLEYLINKIDEYNDSGKNLVKITEELVIFLKNILLYNQAPNYFKNSHYQYQSFVKYDSVDLTKVLEYIDLFNKEINEIKRSNMPKFLLELLIMKLLSIKKSNVVVTNEVKIVTEKRLENPKIGNDIVKEEKKKDIDTKPEVIKQIVVTNKIDFRELQDVRISNTLSRFNKQLMLKLKEDLEPISAQLMNPDVSQIVSIILDGTMKAASDEYAVFVYENENGAYIFNENILDIEKVIESLINKKYKVIATDEDSWNKIKNDFNKKIKVFEYRQEPEFNFNNDVTESDTENTKIDELFGDQVEYEN